MILKMAIVLCIWFPLGGEFSPSNSSIMELLPSLIEQFCPGSDVCPEYVHYSAVPVRPGLTSCCTGCSCSADCEKRNDCCFLESMSTRSNATIENSRCLWPMTKEPSDLTVKSYNMITSMPTNDTTPCGEVSVADWGSMYPVYSYTTKLIYKNSACADAYGVTDGVTWTPLIYCELLDKVNDVDTRARQYMFGFKNYHFPSNCYVYFEYPGEEKDLAAHICYNDVVDICPDADFRMPVFMNLNISKAMIRRACSSGLHSPFYGSVIFSNVFCYVCHDNYFLPNIKCVDTQNGTKSRFSSDGFVGLISQDYSGSSKSVNLTSPATQQLQSVCPESGDADVACRTLYCPAGQLRIPNGSCDLLFKSWYIKPIGVHLTLTSTVIYNISKVLPSSKSQLHTFKSITNPWPLPWKLFSLSYESLAAETTSVISVILQNDEPSNNPNHIIKSITRNVEKSWFLDIGLLVGNVTLKSTFSKFLDISPQQKDNVTINGSQQLKTRFYNIFEDVRNRNPPRFFIDKLFTCDQVELESSEFVFDHDDFVLYNNITGNYLFGGEFVINEDGERARICLEGSGFIRVTDKGCSAAKTSTMTVCVLFCFYRLLFY